ncbi:MAG: patatin-like phospholipase family protein [Ignavibacteria bacterium]|jgi:predicted acylesterase/phospholipase RssA
MLHRIIIATVSLFIVQVASHAQELTLVLTGGGARCITQVGVLKVLEREGIVPDMIVGSSFGAIVGGLYCSGYSAEEIDSIFRSVDWDDLVSLRERVQREYQFLNQKHEGDRSILTLRFNNFTFVPPTAVGGNARFAYLLQRVLWDSPFNTRTNFQELSPRLQVVATNLSDGRPAVLDSGNLATALRASATFPLRYSPVRWDASTVLVDGGLVANIPTEIARKTTAAKIILVNSKSRLAPVDNLRSPWSVADQALSASMMQNDSARIALADVVIEPLLGSWSTFAFSNVDSLIMLGEQAAIAALPKIRALTGGKHVEQIVTSQILLRTTDNDTALASNIKSEITGRLARGSSRDVHRLLSRILHARGFHLGYVEPPNISGASTPVWMIDKGLVAERFYELSGGNSSTTLARESAFPDSSNFSIDQLARAWSNLHAADAIAESDITIATSPNGGTSVEVRAIGNGNQALRLGARLDNERYTQGSLEIAHDNLFLPGLRLAARGVISERIGSLAVGFDVPRISGSLWTTSLRGYSSFRNVWVYSNRPGRPGTQRLSEFSEDRYGLRLSAGRQLERNGVVLAELRYENQRYRKLNDTLTSIFQPLATIRGVARWDDRDNVNFPTAGRTIDLSAESSVLSLSNGLSFTKLAASLSSVFDVGWFRIIPSILIGAADKTLPSAELFSIGGQEMFFGMREDQQRGRQIVVGNMELQTKLPFDIFFDTYLSVRYDIGAVWEVPEYIRIADMNHGLGFTLGIETPIGPAKLSAGRAFAFQERPNKVLLGTPLAYFSIGVRL